MCSSSISAIDKPFCPEAYLLAMLLSKIMALSSDQVPANGKLFYKENRKQYLSLNNCPM